MERSELNYSLREICMDRENTSDLKDKPQIKAIKEDALTCWCGIEMELPLMWATAHCILRVSRAHVYLDNEDVMISKCSTREAN